MSYDDLFCARDLEPGAYVFCDHERLSHIELLAAAEIYALAARAPQLRLFNDPATVRTRYGLLRRLREAGLNAFDAYAADGAPRPVKFPVFVREIATHGKPVTALLDSQAALDAALAVAPMAGYPLSGLIVIEFCAEPFRDNVWQRWGAFRLGGTTAVGEFVSESNWNVKYGEVGLVDEPVYEADHALVRENRYAEVLDQAFELAGIDYGRADFGLVNGRPQIYEINTNPYIGLIQPHASPARMATLAFTQATYLALLAKMDAPTNGERASIELEARKDGKHVIDELRASLRKSRAQFAALEAQMATAREEAERMRAESARLVEEVERLRAPLSRGAAWRALWRGAR